jgi:hypothetical protein
MTLALTFHIVEYPEFDHGSKKIKSLHKAIDVFHILAHQNGSSLAQLNDATGIPKGISSERWKRGNYFGIALLTAIIAPILHCLICKTDYYAWMARREAMGRLFWLRQLSWRRLRIVALARQSLT